MTTIDFKQRIGELRETTLGAQLRPALWGGRFTAVFEQIEAFLAAWKSFDMPWRICEWVSDFQFDYQPAAMPSELEWLERVRLFGPGGDLELRRDGTGMLWRFVGAGDASLPLGFVFLPPGTALGENRFAAYDYWQQRPTRIEGSKTMLPLACLEQRALLWGSRRERVLADGTSLIVWPENRVAGQRRPPVYPGPVELLKVERVDLVYRSFLEADTVLAVWWLGLAAHKEEHND